MVAQGLDTGADPGHNPVLDPNITVHHMSPEPQDRGNNIVSAVGSAIGSVAEGAMDKVADGAAVVSASTLGFMIGNDAGGAAASQLGIPPFIGEMAGPAIGATVGTVIGTAGVMVHKAVRNASCGSRRSTTPPFPRRQSTAPRTPRSAVSSLGPENRDVNLEVKLSSSLHNAILQRWESCQNVEKTSTQNILRR